MRGLIETCRAAAFVTRHDLRSSRRRLLARFEKMRAAASLSLALFAIGAFHALAWPATGWVKVAQAEPDGGSLRSAATAVLLFVFPWLAAQAVNGAARALYARGDLDLVLSAPISSAAVLCARGLAIAAESAVSVGIFAAPFANVAAMRFGIRWLAIYPALAASSLLMTALGAGLAFALFRVVGPRRGRLISQLAAAAIGASFILLLQATAVFSPGLRAKAFAVLGSAPHGLLALPMRAFLGDGSALAAWCAASILGFAVTVACAGPPFARFAARAAGVRKAGSSARTSRAPRFKTGEGRALRTKEWRLLRRDPWLLSQILLQVIYALPIGALIWRSEAATGSITFAVGPTIVVVACQVSASLAWLVVSSEEAPELIATAPVSRRSVDLRKLQSIAPPLLCLLGPPLIALAYLEPLGAALTALFALCAASSSALLNFWRPMPGRRTEILRRHAQSKLVGLMEHLLALTWAVGVCLALMGAAFVLVPIAFALAVLYINRPRTGPGMA